jgi:hypothetical protein
LIEQNPSITPSFVMAFGAFSCGLSTFDDEKMWTADMFKHIDRSFKRCKKCGKLICAL